MDVNIVEVMELIKKIDTITDMSSIENDTLFEEIGLDSLDRMNFFLDIEERFGIQIKDDDFQRLNSIDGIITFLKEI